MKSKYYFKQFKKTIAKDNKKYKTHLEETELDSNKCNHIGKVKLVNGELRCSCGAAWSGPGIERLFDRLKGNEV
ncbi:MAG: hypothetical protein ACTSPI_05240 [Candidatus Heimdallarchaeaceae archaeon]